MVWDAWLSPHDRWLWISQGNWQLSSHVLSDKCQELLSPTNLFYLRDSRLHQTSALPGPAAPMLLAYPSSWWALLWPHGNHTGLLDPGSLHCSTVGEPSATWTSAGELVVHRKMHSTQPLWLVTLWRKQGARLSLNWLFWPDTDQTLTQAVVEQILFFLSLNNLFFLWGKKLMKC